MIELLRSQSHSRLIVQVFSDLNETFLQTSLYVVCSRPTPDWRRWYRWSLPPGRACAQCCANHQNKLLACVHQDGGRRVAEIWMTKYPGAASVVQQVHKLLTDVENRTDPHRLKWDRSLSGPLLWIVWRGTEQICKTLDGKPLFSALHGMCSVRLYELTSPWRWVHRQDTAMQWTKPQWNGRQRMTSEK